MSLWRKLVAKKNNLDFGLTLTSAGWRYKGGVIKETSANQTDNPYTWVAFIMMNIYNLEARTHVEVKGVCVVEGDPPLIVLASDKGHVCFLTSLKGNGLGKFAERLCQEWGATVSPDSPGSNGCWILEKASPEKRL